MESISIYSGIFIGGLIYIFNYIPWTAIFLLTRKYNIYLYELKNKDICQRIQRRIKFSSHITDGNKPYGYSVGKWFLLHIDYTQSSDGDMYHIWLIATKSSYENLTNEDSPIQMLHNEPVKETTSLIIYEKGGSFFSPYYRRREFKIPKLQPRENQTEIIDKIETFYKMSNKAVVLLHGEPGKGKSMVAILIADKYKSYYCNSLKPWDPGSRLGDIYNEAEPTVDKPLIIVFEEFDTIILNIHIGIQPHKSLPTFVSNKNGWNQFLDEISRGLYPYLILILTMNKDPEYIRNLDPSYIREGRVDLILEV